MGEDYSRDNSNTAAVEQQVLRDIRDIVHSMGKDFRTYGLPDVNDAGNYLCSHPPSLSFCASISC